MFWPERGPPIQKIFVGTVIAMVLLVAAVGVAAVITSPEDPASSAAVEELESEGDASEGLAEGLLPRAEGLLDDLLEGLVDEGIMTEEESEALKERLLEGLEDLGQDLGRRLEEFRFELPEELGDLELPEEFGFDLREGFRFELPEGFEFEFGEDGDFFGFFSPEGGESFRFRSPEDLRDLLEQYPELEGLGDLFRFFTPPQN